MDIKFKKISNTFKLPNAWGLYETSMATCVSGAWTGLRWVLTA